MASLVTRLLTPGPLRSWESGRLNGARTQISAKLLPTVQEKLTTMAFYVRRLLLARRTRVGAGCAATAPRALAHRNVARARCVAPPCLPACLALVLCHANGSTSQSRCPRWCRASRGGSSCGGCCCGASCRLSGTERCRVSGTERCSCARASARARMSSSIVLADAMIWRLRTGSNCCAAAVLAVCSSSSRLATKRSITAGDAAAWTASSTL